MIEFEVLAMKTETDNMYIIFLLKKNIRSDIIKIILGYPSITAPEILKEWKVTITLVKQRHKSTESRHNYRTGIEITYRGRGAPIEIRKSKDNYDKDRKPRCFNCNVYRKILSKAKEGKRNKEVLQVQQSTTSCEKLQIRAKNEE